MAVTATTQVLEDGPRNLVVHLTADATANNDVETANTKINVSTLSTQPDTGASCTHVSIERIQFMTQNGLNVKLYWGANTNQLALTLPGSFSDSYDFLKNGAPIVNNAGAGKTGNLLLTSENPANTAPGRYSITLWCRKSYN